MKQNRKVKRTKKNHDNYIITIVKINKTRENTTK